MRFHPLMPAFLLSLFFPAVLVAQDTRHVTEPHVPPACVTLNASIPAHHGIIPEADEHSLDTVRIQHAIDKCGSGRSVVLRADGAKNVFLSGPLTLRSGITQVVDANTALVASRDPRVFDIMPGSCGIVSEHGHGCRPLISLNDADYSAIMGLLMNVAERTC